VTGHLCAACETGEHTEPATARDLCECRRPTCGCYGLYRAARSDDQLRLGGREEYDPATADWGGF
jgi:hypothetical protein